MARSMWRQSDIDLLVENYSKMTTDELCDLFPNKSRKSINRKLEDLRKEGVIGYRDKRTINRAYRQRNNSNRPSNKGGKLPVPKGYEEL